jgi:hypothetical protein
MIVTVTEIVIAVTDVVGSNKDVSKEAEGLFPPLYLFALHLFLKTWLFS